MTHPVTQRSEPDKHNPLFFLSADRVDLERIRAGGTGIFDLMVHVRQRREKGELPARFADLHFQALMSDPVAAIRGAYEKLGRRFEPSFADAIRRYLAEKPKGKHGQHRYDPEDWGYTRDELRERTRAYVESYGVALEE